MYLIGYQLYPFLEQIFKKAVKFDLFFLKFSTKLC